MLYAQHSNKDQGSPSSLKRDVQDSGFFVVGEYSMVLEYNYHGWVLGLSTHVE